MNYDILPSIKNLHQVKLVSHKDPTLQIRDLSCLCVACVHRCLEKQCDSRSHITPFFLQRLGPSNNLEIYEIMYDIVEEIKYGIGDEFIVDVVLVGDNIVVKANG
jgi:hypothetical protein